MNRKAYSSGLTDEEWRLIEPFIPPARYGGRPRTTDIREALNAIFYILRGDCARRLLPHDFPKWQTVYDYFRRRCKSGLWEQIHSLLRERVRLLAGREAEPSACVCGITTSVGSRENIGLVIIEE